MYWTDGKATPSLQCPPSSESRAGYECVKSRERRKGLIYRTERPGFFLGLPTQLSFFPFPAQSEEEECSSFFHLHTMKRKLSRGATAAQIVQNKMGNVGVWANPKLPDFQSYSFLGGRQLINASIFLIRKSLKISYRSSLLKSFHLLSCTF